VQLAESGIKGTREPPDTDEWASEEDVGGDDDDSDAGKKTKGPKPPPDPTSHVRLWMPACMVEMAEPEIVEEYKERKSKKASKKKGKTREDSGATKQSKKKTSKSQKPLYDSDTDQRQTIEDMLAKRKATIQSTPSRRANSGRKMVLQAMYEESEESGSEAMPTFTAHSRTESSKAAAEREKRRKFGYLSLSDEDEQSEHVQPSRATSTNTHKKPIVPAPFPISFNKEDDVLSSSDTHGRLRPTKMSLRGAPSQTSDSEQHQSPRKSLKHTLVESQARSTVSPSRPRPADAKVINTSVIEISSDDSDDSDARPAAVSVQRSIIPPLMLAKARMRNKDQGTAVRTKQTFQDETCDVIDLT